MIADPWFYAAAVPALLIAGVYKGGFGGGLGAMATPLLALAIDPRTAAAVLLPVLCLMDLMGLWAYWGKWHRVNMRIMIPASLIGIAAGALSFRYLDENAIRILIGGIAVVFAGRYWLRRVGREPAPTEPNVAKGGFWSAIAGFTSFVSHAGSPPMSVYLLPQRLPRTTYQATTVVFFAAVNYVKLIPYALLGQFSTANLSTSGALLPLAVAGMALGIWAHNRVSERVFYVIAYALLFIIGVKLLYDGATGLLA
jgi:uncharacterized membrane protein YfcA